MKEPLEYVLIDSEGEVINSDNDYSYLIKQKDKNKDSYIYEYVYGQDKKDRVR